jgi:hypothetical protein
VSAISTPLTTTSVDPARSREKEAESEEKKVSKESEQCSTEKDPPKETSRLLAGMVHVLYLFD